ncbi:PhoH family protein [Anaerosalibacter bizertensis]|uniref:PhoH-like protein n=1 Tax=Anaerosalibacter bizertensis TaxID=932217 RepID=A0A9Q4AC80_9FIRM|nr:PhoH family protein [Anaerosalibacter bizertensis]MBV1817860.1 PhoH family protein [Bacteroidales bacterium MSK.15.36]MCG4565047.1 PhoH family protein [Anaerosalibacter bizertensis]MCG4582036.1 PhoH family protein [Anaerosalibacter bizertensis]
MGKNIQEKGIAIEDNSIIPGLFGQFDENIKIIEKEFNVEILIREEEIKVIGEELAVELVERLIYKLADILKRQKKLTKQELMYTIQLIYKGKEDKVKELLDDIICITASGKAIKPKTLGQKRYVNAIKNNDIVFGIGPAGTGKTYLAMAMAVNAFRNNEVKRIILTRPAVEAGESLGFLPGDLQEKVDPYLRPIYDALFDILGFETYVKFVEKGLIEVAPLAYMRGRTLDSSYVILDEAQNTTNEQMKMFLTRLGFGSKAIITGDITQVDLPKGKSSGLKTVSKILEGVDGIDFVNLTKLDVVRHPLVQKIIEAYDEYEGKA